MNDLEQRLRAAMTETAEPAPSGLMEAIRRRHRRHRRRLIAGSAAVVAVVVAAIGLPIVLQHSGPSGAVVGPAAFGPAAFGPASPGMASPGTAGQPVTGPGARALALAQRLLADVAVPAGTRPAHPAQVPQGLGNPFARTDTSAVAGRMYLAPQPMDTVDAFLRSHAPAGMRSWGTGRDWGPDGVEEENVDWMVSSPPAGIYSAYVDIAIAPRSGGTALIGVYAGVTWIPARSAAEHIDPGRYQRVVIKAVEFGPAIRRVTRAFGSAVVARLAGYLNGLQAEPDVVRSCPAAVVTYQLTFTGPKAPDVVVSADGCLEDGITVGAHAQPALEDQANTLAVTSAELLDIRPALPPGPRR